MKMRLLNKKAQSIQEYVIVFGLVVVALISMQTYMKRGIQGAVKDMADQIGFQDKAEEKSLFWGVHQDNTSPGITRRSSGVEADKVSSDMPAPGMTQRVRVFKDENGAQRTDHDTTTKTTGWQKNIQYVY